MRPALLAALAAPTLFAGLFAGESVLAQGLLSQLEQRIQGSQSPAAGGTAAARTAAAPAGETGYLGAVLDEAGENRGVRVNSVRSGAPAAKGGLQGGDLITSINGKPIKNLDDLDAVLNHVGPDQKVQFGVQRDNRPQQVTVTLSKRPTAAAAADENAGGPAAAAPSLSPPTTATPGAPSLSPPGPFGAPASGTASPDTSPGAPPASFSPSTGSLPPATSPSAGAEAITPPSATAPGLGSPGSGGRFGSIGSQPSAGASLPPSSLAAEPPAPPLNLGPPPGTNPSTALPAFQPPRAFSSPSAGGASGGHASLGITVEPLTPQTRGATTVPALNGAIVTQIKPGSPAERAGLPLNAVIVQADGRRINSADDLVRIIQAAQPGQEIELRYYEGNQLLTKNVQLGSAGSSGGMPSVGAPGGAAGGGPGGLRSAARPGLATPSAASPSAGIGGAGAVGSPLAPGAGGSRPLLSRIEGIADRISRGGAPGAPGQPITLSTVYDPYQMAALQRSVEELTGTVRSLEQRLAAIEARTGVTPASGAPDGAPGNVTPGTALPGAATPGTATPGSSAPGSFGPGTGPGNP